MSEAKVKNVKKNTKEITKKVSTTKAKAETKAVAAKTKVASTSKKGPKFVEKFSTKWIKSDDIKRSWYVIDAEDAILGRLASKVASLLIGKDKINQVNNLDCGDYVIVLNSMKIKVTGNKELKKMYYHHSGYMGGLKETRFDMMIKRNPNFIIEKAVERMLPQNKLKADRMARLFVYDGSEHKHEAQKPVDYKL